MIARTPRPANRRQSGLLTPRSTFAIALVATFALVAIPIQEFATPSFAQQAKNWSTSPPPPQQGPPQQGPPQQGPPQQGPPQQGPPQQGPGGHGHNHGGTWHGEHRNGQDHPRFDHGRPHHRGYDHGRPGLHKDYHGGYADYPNGYGDYRGMPEWGSGRGPGWGNPSNGPPDHGNPAWNDPNGSGSYSRGYGGGFSGGVSVFLNPSDYGSGDPSHPGLFRSQATYFREPFPAGPDAPVATLIPTNAAAATYQQSAEAALRSSQFREAYRWVNHALVEDPRNGQLRLFQVHALTAMQSYAAANAALHQAAPFVQSGEWNSILRRQDEFFTQNDLVNILDQLNQASAEPGVALLIAYHLAFLDPDDSQAALDRLAKLSDDPVAHQLRVELTSGHLSHNE